MTKAELKEILDRVLTWPPERQADVAHMVELMEEQDSSALRLTDEQAAEVRRRLPGQVRKQSPPMKFSSASARLEHEGYVRAGRQRRT
jgi:hypothetical protein